MIEEKITLKNGEVAVLSQTDAFKALKSKNYNSVFNYNNGWFARWGTNMKTDEADPNLGLPEIADIEISTICHGPGKPCAFCYKGNTGKGEYMSLETFIKLFKKLPKTITQIAFGIGDIGANPDMWKIFEYCRANFVVPNVTINGWGMKDEDYLKLAKWCGAVAISYYGDDVCFNAVEALTNLGMNQINIHFMLAEETYQDAEDLLDKIKTDKRLAKLNATVFLSLKQKGRAKKGFNILSQNKFSTLVNLALDRDTNIGFDSCGAAKFVNAISNRKNADKILPYIEPCESSIYSSYFNVKGDYFPCSFIEGTEGWEDGLNVIDGKDFLNEVWWNKKTNNFRGEVINCRKICKSCPVYDI